MGEHSKLPWRANLPERSDGALLASHIVDAEGVAVAQLAHHADDVTRANAAFIVRAANCHAKLVEALEALCEKCAATLPVEASVGYAAIRKARGEAP